MLQLLHTDRRNARLHYPAVPNQALLMGFIAPNRPALDAMRGVTVVALWEMHGIYAGCILGFALCSQHAGCHAAVLQEAPLLVYGGCCSQAVQASVRLRDAQTRDVGVLGVRDR